MASRCLNKVSLIGNLTRDPELRYTPAGVAVVSFGLATNRSWTTQQGEKKEDAQFHRIVAWNKLAELCSQLLSKGRKVFVEGRIQYREWMDSENNKKQVTEIVIDDMIILDSRGAGGRPPGAGGMNSQPGVNSQPGGNSQPGNDSGAVSFDDNLSDVQLDDVVGIEPVETVAEQVEETVVEPVLDKVEEKPVEKTEKVIDKKVKEEKAK